MIPGIVAGGGGAGSSVELTTRIALPLTYDETDYNGLLTWTRLGDGPRLTPEGLLGDGQTARLKATAPNWMDDDAHVLTVHAGITAAYEARNTTRDTVVFVGNDDATANPKLELCILDDSLVATEPNVAVRCYTGSMQTKRLGRRNWRYEMRYPEIVVGGNGARPQGIHFLDADTVLVTAHYANAVSRCHKIRLSDGALLGWFDFDQTPLGANHINAISESSNGDIWFCGNGLLFGVDVDASLLTNEAVVHTTYNMIAAGTSFMSIATISGTEYMISGQYMESGTPRLRVFPFSLVIDGNTFDIGDRTNQYQINQRTQGIVYHNGKIYMSNNRTTVSSVQGTVKRFDLDLGAVDDSILVTSELSVFAPSQYPEDLSVHPVTGRMWTLTEGLASLGSDDGWLAMWSTDLEEQAQENNYTLEYDGAGSVTIKINNRLFEVMSWTPTVNPGAISVGGPPAASAGQQNGFFIGTVRNIVIQDSQLSAAGYASAVGGAYSPNSLTVFPITLVNPGAETGDTTGWTNEVGTFGVRATNPDPHTGSWSFLGGTNVTQLARQRIDLLAETGLTGTQVDAGGLWAIVSSWQAGIDTDTMAIGLRFLDGSSTQITEHIPTEIAVNPLSTWVPTSYGISIPSGTRYVDVLIASTRIAAGTVINACVDDMALQVLRK